VRLLVTGAAGFIGYHLCRRLLAQGERVVGIDSLNDYYDVSLKQARLERLRGTSGFAFEKLDLADRPGAAALFRANSFDAVVHLAAQAGVRHSLGEPLAYVDANLDGFAHVLEGCRHGKVGHLVFASSSSVYGANHRTPFSEHDPVDHPVSFYAATKRSGELMAHVYSHLYRLPVTGLRFFTVYGPWGRPDMAYYSFTAKILAGAPIQVFNGGDMERDFTYVDDIVEGTLRVLDKPAPYALYNIGNHQPVRLLDYISTLERVFGKKARLDMKPMQPGDVKATYADTRMLQQAVGLAPSTPLESGLARFAEWFRSYYGR
jgi:UDP-glucuronate 4-epimerase